MRTTPFGAFLVAACLAFSPLTSKPAHAIALPAPAGMIPAADSLSDTQQVACPLVWRCGYYGCGWRRVCWAPAYSYYRPYGYYRPYYGYYRPWRGYYRYGYYRPWRGYYGRRYW